MSQDNPLSVMQGVLQLQGWQLDEFSHDQVKNLCQSFIKGCKQLAIEYNRIREQLCDAEEENTFLSTKNHQLQQTVQILQEECQCLRQMMNQLQKQKETKIHSISLSEEELKSTCLEMSTELQIQKYKYHDLSQQLSKKIYQVKHLQKCTKTQLQFSQLQQQNTSLKQTIFSLKTQRDNLHHNYDDIRQQNLKLKEDNFYLQQKIQELQYLLDHAQETKLSRMPSANNQNHLKSNQQHPQTNAQQLILFDIQNKHKLFPQQVDEGQWERRLRYIQGELQTKQQSLQFLKHHQLQQFSQENQPSQKVEDKKTKLKITTVYSFHIKLYLKKQKEIFRCYSMSLNSQMTTDHVSTQASIKHDSLPLIEQNEEITNLIEKKSQIFREKVEEQKTKQEQEKIPTKQIESSFYSFEENQSQLNQQQFVEIASQKQAQQIEFDFTEEQRKFLEKYGLKNIEKAKNQVRQLRSDNCFLFQTKENDILILWQTGLLSLRDRRVITMRKRKRQIQDKNMLILGNCEIRLDGKELCYHRDGKKNLFSGNMESRKWQIEKEMIFNAY